MTIVLQCAVIRNGRIADLQCVRGTAAFPLQCSLLQQSNGSGQTHKASSVLPLPVRAAYCIYAARRPIGRVSELALLARTTH
jgi:hypothetical protein